MPVTPIYSGRRLLGSFPDVVSAALTEQVGALGIDVRHGEKVSRATADCFVLASGESLPAKLMVWAAGVRRAGPMSDLDGLEASPSNRLLVRPKLQTTMDDSIVAIGDCASLILPGEDRPLPATAQVVHQQAQHIITHFPGWLDGGAIPALRFRVFASIVSLGRFNAFGSLGGVVAFRGSAAASRNSAMHVSIGAIRLGCTVSPGGRRYGRSTGFLSWSTPASGKIDPARRTHTPLGAASA